MLNTELFRRVVLVIDTAVEQVVLREIERIGFLAYSSVHCASSGPRKSTDDAFFGSSHVRVEALGTTDQAMQLLRVADTPTLSQFSIVCFMDAVQVNVATVAA